MAIPVSTGVTAASREGQALAATLDRMLELARPEHSTTEPAAIDVAAVVDDRLASWAVLAGRRSIDLRRESARAAIGWQDVVALTGAFDAVVDNALKFSPEGGTVTISVTCCDGVRIHVADSGAGLSPGDLPMAADRFWRGPEHGEIPGTGLGLSIASALLELHGGGLQVRPRGDDPWLLVRLVVAAPPEPLRPPSRRSQWHRMRSR